MAFFGIKQSNTALSSMMKRLQAAGEAGNQSEDQPKPEPVLEDQPQPAEVVPSAEEEVNAGKFIFFTV